MSDRAVEDAILEGAHDVADVRLACGAATRCRGCVPAIVELLAAHGREPVAFSDVA